MTRPHPHETMIDITAVAERLGVQVRHVRRLVNERRIPYIKWGHLLRFEPADIERWIASSRRPAMDASAATALADGVDGARATILAVRTEAGAS